MKRKALFMPPLILGSLGLLFLFVYLMGNRLNAMNENVPPKPSVSASAGASSAAEVFEEARKLDNEGNYAEALELYGKLLFGPDAENPAKNDDFLKLGRSSYQARECMQFTINCLARLNRTDESDVFLEKIATIYADQWPMLEMAAKIYVNYLPHNGYVISGVFERGWRRGGGQYAFCGERDRVRALQLMTQCIPWVEKMAESEDSDDRAMAGWFFIRYADFLLNSRQNIGQSWELQTLTNIETLPDYDTYNPYGRGQAAQGAAVDADGNPIYYSLPTSFTEAKNDGERWRWCLAQAAVIQKDDATRNAFGVEASMRIADFAQQQFGVHTLASYGVFFRGGDDNALEAEEKQGGILTVHTLKDNETVAKLATGVKRFTLPEDYDFIRAYETLADSSTHRKFTALQKLASIKSNRRQYVAAANDYKRVLDDGKIAEAAGWAQPNQEALRSFYSMANWDGHLANDYVHLPSIQAQYDQIVKNWGRFEGEPEKPAGTSSFVYRFRNGKKADFSATKVNLDLLFADLEKMYKDMEKKSPFLNNERNASWDWQLQNIQNVGHMIVYQDKKKYLTGETVRWSEALTPAEKHYDRTAEVAMPVKDPGAYFVEAKMEDGNTTYMVMWISDMVLVKKMVEDANWFYVADGVTGQAVPGAKIHGFGYREEGINTTNLLGQNQYKIKVTTKTLDVTADENGQWTAGAGELDNNFQWMLIAQKPNAQAGKNDRLAFLGFQGYWTNRRYDAEYNQVKVFPMTDRPIYRPNQKVNYKFWVNTAKYDQEGKSPFAGQEFLIEIYTPMGEKLDQPALKADTWGGCTGEFMIPADAKLGQYNIILRNAGNSVYGSATFRMEEYKKPEFEVTVDAPKEPVMLGEKITATIKAKYYFGAPVTQGTVKYKVTRTTYSQNWYAPAIWDWFYGSGYWWNVYDYPWYPGWRSWGCKRPMPMWYSGGHEAPEVILEKEITLGGEDSENADVLEPGVIRVEFDTALTKELYPDSDHSYTISAEVVDESRRVITGSGNVLVARTPFRVFSWTDRAYYRAGDVVSSHFQARTLNGKPVTGTGVFQVFHVTYDEFGTPAEKEILTKNVDVNPEGRLNHKIRPNTPGQYRVAYTLTDKSGHAIQGGQLITVTGENFQSDDLRFNDLELIPDKGEYAPGETMKLMVNTNRAGATVILFMRASNGVCVEPRTLKIEGKSTVVEIPVELRDMPNFFVEAVTVANAKVYSETKEICVPPAEHVLNMEVIPSKTNYLPGEKAKAQIKLTSLDGKPYTGSTVVTIYDKSVEYISGGSNVPDIKEFFWKWRRHHYPQTQSSAGKYSYNMDQQGLPGMQFLGIFGGVTENQMETALGLERGVKADMKKSGDARGRQLGFGGGGMGGMGGDGAAGGVFEKAMAKNATKMEQAAVPMAAAAPGMGLRKSNEKAEPDMFFAADKSKRLRDSSVDYELYDESPENSGEAPDTLVEATVRSNFADTALWVSSLETDADGLAEIELDMPENLTTWKIMSWAMGDGASVGSASAEVITRKNLILRMQTPRFLITTDEILLTANVHNYLETEKAVTVVLDIPETSLIKPLDDVTRKVKVPANGETRVDWLVRAENEGECVVRMKALTNEESDAMEMKIPINIHGMMKQISFSGMVRADAVEKDAVGTMKFNVPGARRINESLLQVRFSPTLAGALVDALPYLVDYPYGCTEQTLNRFLPTVLVQKTIIDMGVNLEDVKNKTTNLNAQEIGDPKERAAQWSKNQQKPSWHRPVRNPVFDQDEVNKMTKEGVDRLVSMQCTDGGWGWFSGTYERSSAHLTSLVTRGLMLARNNDVAVDENVINRGIAWLEAYQKEELRKLARGREKDPQWPYKTHADDTDALVYLVLAEAGHKPANREDARTMGAQLFEDRLKISRYALAMIGVAYALQNESEKLKMVVENLSQFLVVDPENQTAWLDLGPDFCWWYWYGNTIETQAMYLRLLCVLPSDMELKIRTKELPENKKPAANLDGQVISAIRTKTETEKQELTAYKPMDLAPQLVKYLLNNRKNAMYWESTRDTANVIEAMSQYLKASGEMNPEMTVEIWVDGEMQKAVEVTKDNLFTLDNTFIVAGDAVKTGTHVVELRRKGAGPLYYNAYFSYFSLEDFITKAGLEIKVERKYYKLIRVEGSRAEENRAGSRGQVTKAKVEKYDRMPLASGAEVISGDLIEVELSIESKNDYTYLMFEDPKPAGFETVDVRSGYNGNPMGAYVEFRDNRVVFFVQNLLHGNHSVSYRMRAEMPGKVSALPTRGEAMYAPELKANSDEMKIRTKDK